MKYKNKSNKISSLISLLTLSFSLSLPVSTLAAEATANETNNSSFVVKDIEVTGLQRMELGTFYNLLPLQVGETLDPSRVPTIIRAIHSSNTFDDIRLFKEGNKLLIDLSERPTISDIAIEGNSDIETDQIIEAMRSNGFAKGEVFDPSAIKNIIAGMQEQYFSHGKYSISIEEKIIRQSRNRVYVKFLVNEGDAAEIQKISIVGNKLFTEEELLKQFELSVGEGMFSFFDDTQYSREKLSGDLETLRSYYLDRGYLKFNNSSTQVAISPDRKGIYITINIDEGEKFTVNEIVYSGDLIISQEALEARMPLVKGDTYSAAAISFAEEQIKSALGVYGYAFAKVVTVPELNEEDNSVKLTLVIEPGKKVYVNRVTFSGNESTNDEVLRREVRLMEGAALSTNLVERSKLRLQRIPYLEEVNVETPKVDQKEDRVDLNYSVKERSAGTISGGIGYSDTFGTSLNANVSHNNLAGSGKAIQFAINKSKYIESYSANMTDPYFTIDGISAGIGLSYSETDYSSINLSQTSQDSFGVTFSLGYPINEVTRINLGAGYQDNKLKAVGYRSQQIKDFFEQNGQDIDQDPIYDYTLYRLNMGITRNTLNRGIFPDRGTKQTFNLSGTVPGSELEFYKLDYKISHYIPLAPGWSFLSSANLSWGDGYGDDNRLPYFENFSAGGSGTMRGFDTNTIGPRLIQRFATTTTGAPTPDGTLTTLPLPEEWDLIAVDQRRSAGGNARAIGTLELIFPVPFVEESNSVRTSFFVDVGNVWDTKFDRDSQFGSLARPGELDKIPDYSDSDTFRVSTGFSLQWLSPMGPLTLSFSRAIQYEDSDKRESFSFNVGKTF
jgi:outer membrane protein insertion porin family